MLKPLPKDRWNESTTAHLLNRAGFGAPPAEIAALAKLSPAQAVDKLVDFAAIPDTTASPAWAKPDPERAERLKTYRSAKPDERREMQRAEQKLHRERLVDLRYWWLQRMAKTPRPLQEKLTLFWHGHFATSVQKVKDPYLMWRQNETFRRHATGDWRTMLLEVTRDPAMLIWLDQAQSRRESPNENYAREVMELFALGEGNYTEQDITEAARALTGLTYDRVAQEPVYRKRQHDHGTKTVLGKTGNLTMEDVLDQIVAQPQAARFITAKLWSFFAHENPAPELVEALATEFRKAKNNFKPVLRQMFLSEEFYAESVMRQQVKSPVQLLIGSVRLLERELPPPLICTTSLKLLGQDLFAPPNVKGWDGGLSWITTNNLLNRYNFAAVLVLGENALRLDGSFPNAEKIRQRLNRLKGAQIPVEVDKLVTAEQRMDKDALVAALSQRFLQAAPKPKIKQTLREYLDTQAEIDDDDVLQTIRLLMSTPEYQLT